MLLDGLMGRVADRGGIQFRVLNRRKGPAVRGPRAQADRKLYAAAMQDEIRAIPNLAVIEAEADDLIIENGRVCGVKFADGREISCAAVVLTTGTFLRGLIHIGEQTNSGRPRRRSAGIGLVANAGSARLRARPSEDRHAAASRWPHHRLDRLADAARR